MYEARDLSAVVLPWSSPSGRQPLLCLHALSPSGCTPALPTPSQAHGEGRWSHQTFSPHPLSNHAGSPDSDRDQPHASEKAEALSRWVTPRGLGRLEAERDHPLLLFNARAGSSPNSMLPPSKLPFWVPNHPYLCHLKFYTGSE